MNPSGIALDLTDVDIEFERIAVTAFKVSPEPERVVESSTVVRVKTFLLC